MTRTDRLRRLSGVIALLGALCIAADAHALDNGRASTRYQTGPDRLDHAVNAFAVRHHLQIAYSPAQVANKHTAGIRLASDTRDALAQLLEGSGLRAVEVGPRVFVLATLAPARTALKAPPRPRRLRPSAAGEDTAVELDTVSVTGSRIARVEFESSLPVTVIDQEQIRSSGQQTLFDLLRHTPGMIGHHPRNVADEGGESQVPVAAAASTSLYSLGPRATLFLLDGRRFASYGLISSDLGGLADLNGIPLAMVDRIEIVRGGISAIYGADAMAGVVNVILKKDYQGGEAGLSLGVSERGDSRQRREYASFGARTPGNGRIFVSLDRFSRDGLLGRQRAWSSTDQRRHGGQDRRIPFGYLRFGDEIEIRPAAGCVDRDTTAAGVECGFDATAWASLQPGQRNDALYAGFRQPLGGDSEFYADVRMNDGQVELSNAPTHGVMPIDPDHPDNVDSPGYSFLNYWFPDVGPVRSRVDTSIRDYTAGLQGTHQDLEWDLSLSYRSNEARNRIDGLISLPAIGKVIAERSYRFDQAGSNPAAVLAELSPRLALRGRMNLYSLSATAEAPLFELPGGTARAAAGFELRHEQYRSRPDARLAAGAISLSQMFDTVDAARNTSALYGEFNLPATRELWLDLAWRMDRSSGYGNQTSPMLGLRWQPLRSLVVRASVGDGYRAPTLSELRKAALSAGTQHIRYIPADALPYPCRVPVYTVCQVQLHARVNEQLKAETSRSRSIGLRWTPSERTSITIDRYGIRRKNGILAVNAQYRPDLYPDALVTDEQGYIVGMNTYFDNIGRTDARGWQVGAEQTLRSGADDRLVLRLSGHYQDRLLRKLSREGSETDFIAPGVAKVAVAASAHWQRGDWTTTLNLRHTGPSTVFLTRPAQTFTVSNPIEARRRAPGTTVAGLNLVYAGYRNVLISANIDNLFDREPLQVDYNPNGYSVVDADVVGRYYSMAVQYRF